MQLGNAILIDAKLRSRTLFGLVSPLLRGPMSRGTWSVAKRVKLLFETMLVESGQ